MKKIRGFANGLRSGAWSENKYTNLTPYSPYKSEINKIIKKHYAELGRDCEIIYHSYKPADGYIHPISIEDIQNSLSNIPQSFSRDLRAVFLCSGSKKQQKFSEMRFGTYNKYYRVIFLFPLPSSMCLYYKTKPKPSICLEYERHGATWIQERKFWKLQFSMKALHSFYLKDVLIHEIGHHVENIDLSNGRKNNSKEGFAEWFALEFGMRNQN